VYAYSIDPVNGTESQVPGSPKTLSARSGSNIVNGDAQISGTFDGSPLQIRTRDTLAGAIDSLVWNGREFIDNFDHGRQLQFDATFDGMGGCFNPTEAGSSYDGNISFPSSSSLQAINANGNVLTTQTRMALWFKSNYVDPSNKCPAITTSLSYPDSYSGQILSNHVLNKKVTIGFQGIPNVIEYEADYVVPSNEHYDTAAFQLIVYLAPEFSRFYLYNVKRGILSTAPGSDQLGAEQASSLPVIAATSDGSYALGIYSYEVSSGSSASYIWMKYTSQDTYVLPGNPTTALYFIFNEAAVNPGVHTHRGYFIVGSLNQVKAAMSSLHKHFCG